MRETGGVAALCTRDAIGMACFSPVDELRMALYVAGNSKSSISSGYFKTLLFVTHRMIWPNGAWTAPTYMYFHHIELFSIELIADNSYIREGMGSMSLSKHPDNAGWQLCPIPWPSLAISTILRTGFQLLTNVKRHVGQSYAGRELELGLIVACQKPLSRM